MEAYRAIDSEPAGKAVAAFVLALWVGSIALEGVSATQADVSAFRGEYWTLAWRAGASALSHATFAAVAGQALAVLIGRTWFAELGLLLLLVTAATGSAAAFPHAQSLAAGLGLGAGFLIWASVRRRPVSERTGRLMILAVLDVLSKSLLTVFAGEQTGFTAVSISAAGWTDLSLSRASDFAGSICAYASILWMIRLNGVSPQAISLALALLVLCLQGAAEAMLGSGLDLWTVISIIGLGQLLRLRAPGADGLGVTSDPAPSGRLCSVHPLSGDAIGRQTPAGNSVSIIVLYALLIAYASLYPLADWRVPGDPLWDFLSIPVAGPISKADVVSNVLAYLPLGYLIAKLLRSQPLNPFGPVLWATALGALLSFCMESIQQYLPSRTPSTVDLLTNTLGTLIGAWMSYAVYQNTDIGGRMRTFRDHWFVTGATTGGGLAAISIWVLAQLSPFAPSLDIGTIRHSLSGIWHFLQHPSNFDRALALTYALNITGLGLLAGTLIRPDRKFLIPFAAIAGGTLFLKIFIAGRTLSPEALSGLFVAVAVLAILQKLTQYAAALGASFFIAAGFAISELTPLGGRLYPFNWVPFASEIERNLNGFGSILAGVWPFVALGYLAQLVVPRPHGKLAFYSGMIIVAAVASVFEWWQTFIPGRYGDITTVLLALFGWRIAWYWRRDCHEMPQTRQIRRSR